MTAFFSSSIPPGIPPATLQDGSSAQRVCPSERTLNVSADRREIYHELDAAIAELSACLERAYKDGDRVGAAIYLERRDAAIRSKTTGVGQA